MNKELVKEYLKDFRLMIATPCYGGQLTSEYTQSIVNFTRYATEIDFKFLLFTSNNESLITRARNRAVSSFLKTDATHLMFIDSDIGFEPLSIFRMLLHDVDVVCGIYPMKGIVWEFLLNKKFETVDEIKSAAFTHPFNRLLEVNSDNGLTSVEDAPTGFMLIKREVIEKMIEANPQWSYFHDDILNSYGDEWHAIFDCEIEGKRYLSEDYSFCRRWQRIGGTVWVDPMITLTHTGSYLFG